MGAARNKPWTNPSFVTKQALERQIAEKQFVKDQEKQREAAEAMADEQRALAQQDQLRSQFERERRKENGGKDPDGAEHQTGDRSSLPCSIRPPFLPANA